MKHLRIVGLAVLGACLLTSLVGIGTASATKLYKYTTPGVNDALSSGDTYTTAIGSGLSFLVKDTGGTTTDTCTGFHEHGHISMVGGQVKMERTTLLYTGCSHNTMVLAVGSLEIKHIAGTTNGSVVSTGLELTIQSTVFGISCIAKTGTGVTIGTLTGAKSSTGTATMDINGVVPLGALCGDSTMTGTFTVASPLGLIVEAS